MKDKNLLHPRNRHNSDYDFTKLCNAHSDLSVFVHKNKFQNLTIDFSNAEAVIALNTALLNYFYNIKQWGIPSGYLCPPIPGRVDYIHYLQDLLLETNNNKLFNGNKVSVLDIGTGASCIYPLLAHQEYQWQLVASDIDPISIKVAKQNITKNILLKNKIECRLQNDDNFIFKDIIRENEHYELSMCNPPFHSSLAEATQGTKRKWKNLNRKPKQEKATLNFGGQKAELWCKGGELTFIRNMIKESRHYQTQVLWFTCLVSKKDNISALKLSLKKANVSEVKIINMAQGNKISRFIAWTFLNKEQQLTWCNKRLTQA